ncbi:PREDICTED: mas-related G-protein coupled receptor member H-like [Calidris pugnax]|uniref:mas-related G-protein coupled receptor member H-like n=1 Tax=Calidris pugnax TaxID=198806 RepID=UPI00071C2CA3|nr:PREDICTED: mas-related G-protein coupled receptor member H-like [Calidris pugnax]
MDRHPNNTIPDWHMVFPEPTESMVYRDGHNGTKCLAEHIPEIITSSITLLICLCGLVGNGAILWLLGFHIRRTPFTAYLLNLAVADACFLLCTSAFLITYHMPWLIHVQTEVLQVLLLFHSMALLTYSTSLYLLTAISVERCICVLWPFWSRCQRPKLLSTVMCSLLWALACVLAGLVYFLCDPSGYKRCKMLFGAFCFLNFCILPPFMVLSNVIIFVKLRRSSWQHHPVRLYTVIFLTVLFFILFGIPLSVQIFFHFGYINVVFEICLLLASFNSSINPVIYVLVGSYRNGNSRFRGSVKVALQRVFEERADSQEVGETPVMGIAT